MEKGEETSMTSSSGRVSSPDFARLATEEEVLTYLRAEVALSSQAAVARRYSLAPSQLNDILHERGGLSKAALGKLRWELVRLYRKLKEGEEEK
jgi:hypothetical protein